MATNKPSFFFAASQSVDDHLGKTSSFIWASYAGLRELWWQVRGFKNNFPHLHISEIQNKFFSGLPLPGGIDIKHVCLDTDWATNEQEFSKWLLFDACTIYEGWAEKVCSLVFNANQAEKCAKDIQFPNGTNRNGNPTGFQLAIQLANQNISNLIATQFFPSLSSGKYNKWSQIQELLIGYRYFKECRNAYIHSDGIITNEIINAHSDFNQVLITNPNLLRSTFSLPLGAIGEKIQLNIKDVILFTRIIKSLISTFDAALCVSLNCESILENRVRNLVSTNVKWKSLPRDTAKRQQRINRALTASRIPEPVDIGQVDTWMVSKGMIN
jgi:hypothetical protein